MKLLICYLLSATFLACSQSPPLWHEEFSRDVPPTVAATSSPSVAEPPVTLVGVFSNVESNGEHQWGYTIEIWRQQDRYFGLVFGDDAPRAVGDGPRASIENAVFDPGSNRLHFTTRLDHASCRAYEFDGWLTEKKLEGRFSPLKTACPDEKRMERIALRKSEKETSETAEFQKFRSFTEWKAYADWLLR
ncbi:MAG: hypothetical protein IPJ30_04665 [Acidobacteria bacterium]|nr:hypothetical protein [Acidobacteriota bacterium]